MDFQKLGAEAIKEVERLTREAAAPKTINLAVPDGSGGTASVPVLVNGSSITVLAEATEKAAIVAARLRALEGGAPKWRSGTAHHQSLESFIAHVLRFKDAASVVWANPAERRFDSVLDYDPAGAESPAAWSRHRGEYACPPSVAWCAWGGERGLTLSQEEFAELLDSRDYELTGGKLPGTEKEAPSPASLVTLANNLEVYSTATAKRERDPKTGRVQVSFTEDKGVNGTVLPPPAFLILIPVFQDSQPQALEVRLRVTVEEGKAVFAANIHGASDVLRRAFEGLCATVEQETEVPVFTGTPERPA